MLKVYRRRLIIGLIVLLIVFAIVFAIAFLNLKKGIATFGIGIPADIENFLVMGLSILSMIKVIFEIVKIEKIEHSEEN